MKIKYNSLILMFLALFLIVSCTKDLRLVPKDQLTEVGFWTNSNDFTLAANAFYSTLPTFNYADEESDIAFGMPNSLSNGKLQTSDESGVWNNAYISIRNANVFLGKAALSTGLDIKRYVTEVISSNNYSLFTGKGDQSYRYLFIDEGDASPESLLDHRYARSVSGHSYSYS